MPKPSKFNMGDTPRTRTGLVPTSYRRNIEELSFPWSTLPQKPKPQMYPYRGDYVNERNRKLQLKRKLAKKQNEGSVKRFGIMENEGLDSKLTISRYNIKKKDTIHLSGTKKWDSNYKDASIHKLSEDERRAKDTNRTKFVSFLRDEALKRKKELNVNNCTEIVVRQRKPPVPRLSHLARKRELEKNQCNGRKNPQESKTKCMPPTSGTKTIDEASTNRMRAKTCYLDFITAKRGQSYPQKHFLEHPGPVAANLIKNDAATTCTLKGHGYANKKSLDATVGSYLNFITTCENKHLSEQNGTHTRPDAKHIKFSLQNVEDDNLFHQQIQDIVERAAGLVLSEKNIDRNRYTSTDHDNRDRAVCDLTGHGEEAKLKSKLYASSDFFRIYNKKVSLLEEQVLSLTSSVVSENGLSFNSVDAEEISDNFFTWREKKNDIANKICTGKLETKEYERSKKKYDDLPRHPSFECIPASDFSNFSDSSSSCSKNFLTDIYPYHQQPNYCTSIVDEISSQSHTTSTCLSVSIRSDVESSSICAYPMEAMPSPIRCSEEPHKFLWEEEPLPRGCVPKLNKNMGDDDFIRNTKSESHASSQSVRSSSIAEDLYSLL